MSVICCPDILEFSRIQLIGEMRHANLFRTEWNTNKRSVNCALIFVLFEYFRRLQSV